MSPSLGVRTTTTISQAGESENVIADTTRGRTDRTVV